eukprot:GCRY01002232.1.p1 GENE.GCRY01002232.1~~GCRY01002232.1.p1  ORF type:complete len:746 (+),score=215.51 GCRY01002232.1:129-2366(+)
MGEREDKKERRLDRSESRDRVKDRDGKHRRRERSRSRERDISKSRIDLREKREKDRRREKSRSRDRRRDKDIRKEESKHAKEEDKNKEEEKLESQPKKEPLSMEYLLQKKREAEASQKPVFLSKKQREELAIQKREEQVKSQREKLREEKQIREEFLKKAHEAKYKDVDRERDRVRFRERERERERNRERDREREIRHAESNDQKIMEALKESYLGKKDVQKKKFTKASEKFKFVFDWDEKEDTSVDLNPLYQYDKIKGDVLYGRGRLGGFFVDERKKRTTVKKGKDVHWTEKALSEMTERDWRIVKEDFNITIRGAGVQMHPMRNWSESGLSQDLLDIVKEVGYEKPTPIQMASIPVGLEMRDIIGLAETGSGKTASFILPLLMYIKQLPKMTMETEINGPYALIMAPTRELIQQIEKETRRFAAPLGFRTVVLVGGQSIQQQGFELRNGCEIVIATPGRLQDCLESQYIVLSQCSYVVLDEADRMVDLGFEPQLQAILDQLPVSNLKPAEEDVPLLPGRMYRQTVMFSATMPQSVERLARKYLRNPVNVVIGRTGDAVSTIKQQVSIVREGAKKDLLLRLLRDVGTRGKFIIFCNLKSTVDMISRLMDREGYRSRTVHGGKKQDEREASLQDFRDHIVNILIATDVLGRGIDVPDVTHVVNYDMPSSIEPYTHRIGRTGRAGKSGTAVTFLTEDDSDLFWHIRQNLISTNNPVPPELERHEKAKVKPGSIVNKHGRSEGFITD